jgi:tRNA U54 and U55 pseudouridine synthase Pus10
MIEVIKQLVDALQTYGDKHRKTYLLGGAWDEEITKGDAAIQAGKKAIAKLESQERNFCQRCGKRLGKRLDGIDSIHTCTPPMEQNI